jgi:hypothetical protein
MSEKPISRKLNIFRWGRTVFETPDIPNYLWFSSVPLKYGRPFLAGPINFIINGGFPSFDASYKTIIRSIVTSHCGKGKMLAVLMPTAASSKMAAMLHFRDV